MLLQYYLLLRGEFHLIKAIGPMRPSHVSSQKNILGKENVDMGIKIDAPKKVRNTLVRSRRNERQPAKRNLKGKKTKETSDTRQRKTKTKRKSSLQNILNYAYTAMKDADSFLKQPPMNLNALEVTLAAYDTGTKSPLSSPKDAQKVSFDHLRTELEQQNRNEILSFEKDLKEQKDELESFAQRLESRRAEILKTEKSLICGDGYEVKEKAIGQDASKISRREKLESNGGGPASSVFTDDFDMSLYDKLEQRIAALQEKDTSEEKVKASNLLASAYGGSGKGLSRRSYVQKAGAGAAATCPKNIHHRHNTRRRACGVKPSKLKGKTLRRKLHINRGRLDP